MRSPFMRASEISCRYRSDNLMCLRTARRGEGVHRKEKKRVPKSTSLLDTFKCFSC